jgi:hypothetical protein
MIRDVNWFWVWRFWVERIKKVISMGPGVEETRLSMSGKCPVS